MSTFQNSCISDEFPNKSKAWVIKVYVKINIQLYPLKMLFELSTSYAWSC